MASSRSNLTRPRNAAARATIQEIARFESDGIEFTICVSIRGRLEIQATDSQFIWSASFSNAETLSLSAGSLSADGAFAFLSTGFSSSGGRSIKIIRPENESGSLVLILTGHGILNSGGYSFALPVGRHVSASIDSFAHSLRAGNRSKNNPVIRFYERIRQSKQYSEPIGQPRPVGPSAKAGAARVVVPDEEAITAYRESMSAPDPPTSERAKSMAIPPKIAPHKMPPAVPGRVPAASVSVGPTPRPSVPPPKLPPLPPVSSSNPSSGKSSPRQMPPALPPKPGQQQLPSALSSSPASNMETLVSGSPKKSSVLGSLETQASAARMRNMSEARTQAQSLSAFKTPISLPETEAPAKSSARHLFVDFRLMPQLPLGPNAEVSVVLCSREKKEVLSEPFFFVVGADGKPPPLYGGKSTRTVFRELPFPLNDLIMVMRLFRRPPSESKSSSVVMPRKPLAMGILDLSATPGLARIGFDIVEAIPLQSITDESQFWCAHDPALAKPTDLKPSTLRAVGVSLIALPAAESSTDASPAAQRAAEILSETLPTFPLQAVGDSSLPPQPIVRHDLYLTLVEGSFIFKKPQQLEITAKLVAGDQKQNSTLNLRRGSGVVSNSINEDSHSFYVIPASPSPHWDETVVSRLSQELLRPGDSRLPVSMVISAAQFDGKKRKEICKGQITLIESNGIPISNGVYTVQLTSPSLSSSEKASVQIRTRFVHSSAANATLASRLMNWKGLRLDDLVELIQTIPQSLADIPYPLIPATLGSLIGVLDNYTHDFVASAVVSGLCAIISSCLEDKQPKQAREALDHYVDAECTGMKNPERLYGALAKYIEKPKDKPMSQTLAAIRSLTYISRICALSAFVQPDGSAPPGPELFRSSSYIFELDLLLRRLNDIMASKDGDLHSTQITAFRNIPLLVDHMAQIVKPRDAGLLISSLLTDANTDTPALVLEKVKLIDYFARSGSPVLEDAQLRAHVWPVIIRETTRHIRASTKPPASLTRLAEEEACRNAIVALHQLIDFAQTKACPDEEDTDSPGDQADKTILELLLTTAAPAIASVLPTCAAPADPSKSSAAVMRYDMAMAFLAALYVVPGEEVHRILGLQTSTARNHIIGTLVDGLADLMSSPSAAAFPPDWDEMIQFQYKASETVLASLATYLSGTVLPEFESILNFPPSTATPSVSCNTGTTFGGSKALGLPLVSAKSAEAKLLDDTISLAKKVLCTMATFVTSPQLHPTEEQVAAQPDGLASMADELRDSITYNIPAIWNNLGTLQFQFLEQLMKEVLLFSVSKPKAMKKSARMMVNTATEQCIMKHGSASPVRSLFVEALMRCYGEVFVALGSKENIVDWANTFVSEFCSGETSEDAKQPRESFLANLPTLVAAISDVEAFKIETDIDARMIAVARLIELLSTIDQDRGRAFQLSALADIHLRMGATVEAGFALAALSETLPWGNELIEFAYPHEVTGFNKMQRPTKSTRKVQIITEAMELLAMGSLWEEALSVSLPLVTYYDQTFQRTEYLGIIMKQASYTEAIIDPQRSWPTYWYIKYNGPTFPDFIRSTPFIICNYASENQADMHKRLQAAYPAVSIINSISKDSQLSSIDYFEVQPLFTDAAADMVAFSEAFPFADPSTAQHRLHRRANRWRCTVRDSTLESDYEFETMNCFPALIPRLTVSKTMVNSRLIPTRSASPPPSSIVGIIPKSVTPPTLAVDSAVDQVKRRFSRGRAGSNGATIQLSLPAVKLNPVQPNIPTVSPPLPIHDVGTEHAAVKLNLVGRTISLSKQQPKLFK